MSEAYQVIARRWRPRQFDEIVGQEHIVRTLKNAIERNRIAHAYLFVGPRGTGKTSTARIFAKALNAEGGPNVHPDDSTDTAKAIMAGNCMDVIEIDGASNNSVEQVRDLREDCQYAPAQCTFKIYIIDEVHMLSQAAFNALLKTLEEPPRHVKFIFATTEANKVLPTIVSRCQRFEFRPIDDKLIAQRLSEISKSEGIIVDDSALAAIARLANGGMRDAQSILDQMISFCGDSITEQDVLDVYGLASAGRIEELAKAMAHADYARIVGIVDELAGEGRDLYRVLLDLQEHVRAALMDSIRHGGRSERLGRALSTESLMRMVETLHESESSVQKGLSEKVNFEVALLKAVEASRARAIDSLIREISTLASSLPDDGGQKKKPLRTEEVEEEGPGAGAKVEEEGPRKMAGEEDLTKVFPSPRASVEEGPKADLEASGPADPHANEPDLVGAFQEALKEAQIQPQDRIVREELVHEDADDDEPETDILQAEPGDDLDDEFARLAKAAEEMSIEDNSGDILERRISGGGSQKRAPKTPEPDEKPKLTLSEALERISPEAREVLEKTLKGSFREVRSYRKK